jgi:hypothetical protein
MNKSLTAQEVYNYAGKTVPMYIFSDLQHYENIDELFGDSNSILILYLSKPLSGHYATLNRIFNYETNEYDYHFFDSYGIVIDNERFAIPEKFRKDTEQDVPYLLQMLADKKYAKIYYNEKKIQEDGSAVCGRYAAMFIRYNKIPIDRFVNIILSEAKKIKMTPDEYIYYMSELTTL